MSKASKALEQFNDICSTELEPVEPYDVDKLTRWFESNYRAIKKALETQAKVDDLGVELKKHLESNSTPFLADFAQIMEDNFWDILA